MAKLFGTGFEDLTVFDAQHLSNYQTFSHRFNPGAPTCPFWIDDGTYMVGSPAPHSGLKCLGSQVINSQRNEFLIWQWNWGFSNIWFMDVWWYFPSNWHCPNSLWDSVATYNDARYSTDTASGDLAGLPALSVTLEDKGDGTSPSSGLFALSLHNIWNYATGHKIVYAPATYYQLKRGQWTHVQWYIDRGTVDMFDASSKLWIDGELLIDTGTVFNLKSSRHNDATTMELNPFNLYSNGVAQWNDVRWCDDLEIWNGLPTTKPTLAVKSTPQGIPVTISRIS